MRKLLFITFCLSVFTLNAQDRYQEEVTIDAEGKIYFEEIVAVPGDDKQVLYARGREWFVTFYNSAEDVLQMEDKESGKLIGKAFSEITVSSLGIAFYSRLHYTVSLAVKDNKYRCIISDLRFHDYPSQYIPNPQPSPIEIRLIDGLYKRNGKPMKVNASYKEATLNSIDALLIDLEKAMQRISTDSEDDW